MRSVLVETRKLKSMKKSDDVLAKNVPKARIDTNHSTDISNIIDDAVNDVKVLKQNDDSSHDPMPPGVVTHSDQMLSKTSDQTMDSSTCVLSVKTIPTAESISV